MLRRRHLLIPGTSDYVQLHGKEELRMRVELSLVVSCPLGDIMPNYLDGSNTITRVLTSTRGRRKSLEMEETLWRSKQSLEPCVYRTERQHLWRWTRSQGMSTASGSWKKEATASALEAAEETALWKPYCEPSETHFRQLFSRAVR